MNPFLTMKAWQLFLLFIVPYVVSIVSAMVGWDSRGISIVVIVGCTVVSLGSVIAWLWAIGTYMNRKASNRRVPAPLLFRICLFYTVIYFTLFLACCVWAATGSPNYIAFTVLVPFHLLTAIAFLYIVHFIAKKLFLVQRRKKGGFSNITGPFILLCMYPVGVWFIQPAVNRMHEKESTERGYR